MLTVIDHTGSSRVRTRTKKIVNLRDPREHSHQKTEGGFLYHYHFMGPIGDMKTIPLSPVPSDGDKTYWPYFPACFRGVVRSNRFNNSQTQKCIEYNLTSDDYIPREWPLSATSTGTPSENEPTTRPTRGGGGGGGKEQTQGSMWALPIGMNDSNSNSSFTIDDEWDEGDIENYPLGTEDHGIISLSCHFSHSMLSEPSVHNIIQNHLKPIFQNFLTTRKRVKKRRNKLRAIPIRIILCFQKNVCFLF